MIWEDLLPYYLSIGVPYDVFMSSCPKELNAFVIAYKNKRKIEDERDWMLGQYVLSAFATVISGAFSKNSSMKYVEHPFLQDIEANEESEDSSESNEMLAAAEFQKFAKVMEKQGLPKSGVIDSLKG